MNQLIFVIHGMDFQERGERLDKLVEGIRRLCKIRGIEATFDPDAGKRRIGERRVEISRGQASARTITLREAYWADLAPALSDQTLAARVVKGVELLVYWLFTPTLGRMLRQSWSMTVSSILTIAMLVTWYWGTLAAGFEAIGSGGGGDISQDIQGFFKTVGDAMGGWTVWLAATAVLGLAPVNKVIDISYATHAYLKNRGGLRGRIEARILDELATARREAAYDQITIVSHSFGVAVAAEVLARLSQADGPPVRLVTLGGPLALLAARDPRIEGVIGGVLENQSVGQWTDIHSHQDWLCTRSPVEGHADKFRDVPFTATVSLWDQISGKSHDLYLENEFVAEAVIG